MIEKDIIAAAVGIYFGVVKPKQNDKNSTSGNASSSDADSSTGSSNSTGSSGTKNLVAVTGTDGSTITTDSGSTFTYKNSFGGTWYFDPANPLVSGARAQSWTPALNETFNFGEDDVTVPLCRVRFKIDTSETSNVSAEAWLPPSGNWNKRFISVGNGDLDGCAFFLSSL